MALHVKCLTFVGTCGCQIRFQSSLGFVEEEDDLGVGVGCDSARALYPDFIVYWASLECGHINVSWGVDQVIGVLSVSIADWEVKLFLRRVRFHSWLGPISSPTLVIEAFGLRVALTPEASQISSSIFTFCPAPICHLPFAFKRVLP